MNRPAYLTSSLAIKTLANLSKANITLHGTEHVPLDPVIFVINHFTRIETILLPHYLYKLVEKPIWSLASGSLFKGGLEHYFNLVGVVSTDDPNRDDLVVKTLLAHEANWVIFPEGSMVKTKQIMNGNKLVVDGPKGAHRPHTGAAALALRTEIYRRHLLNDYAARQTVLDELGIDKLDAVSSASVKIVPVNLTYYPIRARENILSSLAEKMVKGLSERAIEEFMTEGTMMLSGVDIDVRFGKPIDVASYLEKGKLGRELKKQDQSQLAITDDLKSAMKSTAGEIMHRYMQDIYAMTTVNHEHLFASFLRLVPTGKICEKGLRKRTYLAANRIADLDCDKYYYHRSLKGSQAHLLTDDRHGKFADFLQLALEKGILIEEDDCLYRDKKRLSAPISFHRSRIDNPVEIMANEVKPLTWLKKLLGFIAIQPGFLLKINIFRHIYSRAKQTYKDDVSRLEHPVDAERLKQGRPFLLPGLRRDKGVVLIHSYLATPGEVRELANRLWRKGYWVYGLRLPGHGTSSTDLAQRGYKEWIDEVEEGYLLMHSACKKVIFCGVAVGASLALEAASRIEDIAGVVAVSPPGKLSDYSKKFMPNTDLWNRFVNKIQRQDDEQYFEFISEDPHMNYKKNPFTGILEVGKLLDLVDGNIEKIRCPVFIIQGNNNPVINEASSRLLYDRLQYEGKQFGLYTSDLHIIINGKGSGPVQRAILSFISRM